MPPARIGPATALNGYGLLVDNIDFDKEMTMDSKSGRHQLRRGCGSPHLMRLSGQDGQKHLFLHRVQPNVLNNESFLVLGVEYILPLECLLAIRHMSEFPATIADVPAYKTLSFVSLAAGAAW
ncbi:glucose-methanol-choline oxidoreductasefamily protein [Striga asiatica]|uniref:Glucose-methanol-choline oxidoreductasefamily protein n=1 Tax=Striga asiatica TaxID=4170 RepID=A0A5A7PKC8_STRAF|nr:glucose-methanol-choline oxidoreductasefamily protein [Striga asiatica]